MDVPEDPLYDKPCSPSEDIRCYWANLLLRYMPMFILFIGTIGNILNVVLLSRKAFRDKPVFLLLFLSVFDFFFLWATVPWRVLGMFYDIQYYDVSPILCKINAWIGVFSASASLWTMAVVSVDRAVVVLSHAQRNVLQNRNKNLAILCFVVSVMLAMTGTMVLFGHTNENPSEGPLDRSSSATTTNCFYISAEFGSDVPLVLTIAFVFQLIIPVLAVVIANVILLTYFCKRRKLFANSRSTDSQTNVLLLLTNFLLVTVIPFSVVNYSLARLHGSDNFISPNLAILKTLAMNLMLSNFSLNFLFFFLGGVMFRKEMKRMLEETKLFCWKRSTSNPSQTQTSRINSQTTSGRRRY